MTGKRDCAVEGLDGEVSWRAVGNYRLRDLTHCRFLDEIICKVILSLFKSMISRYEYLLLWLIASLRIIIRQEDGTYQWLMEATEWL
jgi:hypothetical protein